MTRFRKSVVWQRSGLLRPRGGESRLGRGPLLLSSAAGYGRSNEPGHDLLWAWLAFLGRRAADCRISCARLRFSAAIKAITGGRVMTSQTDRGANSRPELIMDPAGIPCREISDALREAVEANQSKRFKKQPQNRGAAPATHLLSFNKPTAI